MQGDRILGMAEAVNAYTDVQVRDILEEAHRLECSMRTFGAIMGIAVRKLDSLKYGRMDA